MIWRISASTFNVWDNFQIELSENLALLSRETYHLTGCNGSGKTSFLKRVLLPMLNKVPEQQYILYLEQQIQSQFDAIKAYAAMQQPPVHIETARQMFSFQILHLSKALKCNPRPLLVISDESGFADELSNWLEKLDQDMYCLVYTSHASSYLDQLPGHRELSIQSINPGFAILSTI